MLKISLFWPKLGFLANGFNILFCLFLCVKWDLWLYMVFGGYKFWTIPPTAKSYTLYSTYIVFMILFLHISITFQVFPGLHYGEITIFKGPQIFPTSFPAHLFAIRGWIKEALEHFKYVIKICPNGGHIFSE